MKVVLIEFSYGDNVQAEVFKDRNSFFLWLENDYLFDDTGYYDNIINDLKREYKNTEDTCIYKKGEFCINIYGNYEVN